MSTELTVWERDGRVERVAVPDEGLTIGRKPPAYGASYCTTNTAVSRLHCRLARLGEGWFVEDLGSANGTNVNGELAEGPTPVRSGDTIVIGGDEHGLKLQLHELIAPEPAPTYLGETLDRDDDSATQFAELQPSDKIRSSYDIVAERYANELADDMIARPLERGMLIAYSELLRPLGHGTVGDVGCGPGHVAKFLFGLHNRVVGYDISAAMIAIAKKRVPECEFHVGSMYDLPVQAGEWIGAMSMWATLHCDPDERARTFRELRRVVRTGGFLFHSFYVSAIDQPEGSIYRLEKWFGHQVELYTYFIGIEDAATELTEAGFEVVAALVREPMFDNELPARRCYMIAKRT